MGRLKETPTFYYKKGDKGNKERVCSMRKVHGRK